MSVASAEFGSFNKVRRERVKGVVPEILRAPKDVMEAGPVLIEEKGGQVRSQWELFKEYCGKAKFFITGEFYGERAAAMVDPEVKSRHGNAKEETGDFWNPRGLFREAAVLAANIGLVDQGKLSKEELARQYDGLTANGQDSVEQLRGYLSRLFGRIKYRELERKDAIQKREKARSKVTLIPEITDKGDEDTHKFWVGSWADLHEQQMVTQEIEGLKASKKVMVVSALGVVTVFATACAPAMINPTSVATPEIPVKKTSTATNSATATTEAPRMTPTPTYHVEAAGGEYNSAQEALNNSPSALEQEARIQRWLDYWVNFENRPFAVNTDQIHWKFIYDNFNNPTEVMVVLEAGGEYGNRIFTAPIGGDGFAEFPPPVSGNTIQENYGPLELTSGAEGLTLSVENGIPVRRDLNGAVVERLNMQNGQWERVGLDMEMFHNVPVNYEYLLAHPDEFVQAPNPITERAAFDAWVAEVLTPAIGPKAEREVNVRVNALGQGGGLYSAWPDRPVAISGDLDFFYFENSGVNVPVLIINVSRGSDPNFVDQTFCVGLFGGSFSPTPNGTDTLQLLSSGAKLSQIDIFLNTSSDLLSGVQLGDMAQTFIDSTGDAWANLPDNIAFGLGQVYLVP